MENANIYLQTLQSLISRLNANSFLIKGWSVTLGSAFLGLAITTKSPTSAIFGLGPIFIFWLLDSYYLMIERRYRSLFIKAFNRNKTDDALLTFDHQSQASSHSLIDSAVSIPMLCFYGGAGLALIIGYLVLN